MINAIQALELLKQSGHMDCDTELAKIERDIKKAINNGEYQLLIDLECYTPTTRRVILLTLGDLGYRKCHNSGNRWTISWY